VRELHRRGKAPTWLVSALESIPGWTWEPRLSRQASKAALLRTYVEKHGWKAVHHDLVVRDVRLGTWLSNCRARHADGTLSASTSAALSAIPGFRF
jgi:hypothetical protein